MQVPEMLTSKTVKFYFLQALIEEMAKTGAISKETGWSREKVYDFHLKWMEDLAFSLKES